MLLTTNSSYTNSHHRRKVEASERLTFPPEEEEESAQSYHNNMTNMYDSTMPVTPAAVPPIPPTTTSIASVGHMKYQFVIKQELCGRLIGQRGNYIKNVQKQTGTRILVYEHYNLPDTSICSVEGSQSAIDAALRAIRSRFPTHVFPELTLEPINVFPVPPTAQPTTVLLPTGGVMADVLMSSLITAGHFFVQQPFQYTYQSLAILNDLMTSVYNEHVSPGIEQVAIGMIVAAPVMGGWYRALIVDVDSSPIDPSTNLPSSVVVRFVDYGGYSKVDVKSLRQIRMDFMELPFQANECYLSDVAPIEGNSWSTEANEFFENLARGTVLKTIVTGMTADGCFLVRLYRIETNSEEMNRSSTSSSRSSTDNDESDDNREDEEEEVVTDSSSSSSSTNTKKRIQSKNDLNNNSVKAVFINEALVSAGHAKWIETSPTLMTIIPATVMTAVPTTMPTMTGPLNHDNSTVENSSNLSSIDESMTITPSNNSQQEPKTTNCTHHHEDNTSSPTSSVTSSGFNDAISNDASNCSNDSVSPSNSVDNNNHNHGVSSTISFTTSCLSSDTLNSDSASSSNSSESSTSSPALKSPTSSSNSCRSVSPSSSRSTNNHHHGSSSSPSPLSAICLFM